MSARYRLGSGVGLVTCALGLALASVTATAIAADSIYWSNSGGKIRVGNLNGKRYADGPVLDQRALAIRRGDQPAGGQDLLGQRRCQRQDPRRQPQRQRDAEGPDPAHHR